MTREQALEYIQHSEFGYAQIDMEYAIKVFDETANNNAHDSVVKMLLRATAKAHGAGRLEELKHFPQAPENDEDECPTCGARGFEVDPR